MSVDAGTVAPERTSRMVFMTKLHVGHCDEGTTAGRHAGYATLREAVNALALHATGTALMSPCALGSMPENTAGPPRSASAVRKRPPAARSQAAAVAAGAFATFIHVAPPSALTASAGAPADAGDATATPAA